MLNYWMHRIKHEWEVSYPLLELGYISLGWSSVSSAEALNALSVDDFEEFCVRQNIIEYRSRWNIWHFSQFKPDDYVVIPQFEGKFQVVAVVENPKPVSKIEIKEFVDAVGKKIILKDEFLYSVDDNRPIDIGFICKVKPVTESIYRSDYADSKLTARMKMRQTNGNIDDIKENIENSIISANENKPINFYKETKQELARTLLRQIGDLLNPDKVERLVKAYFQRMGATNVLIPSKNEKGKKDGADADVIAIFEPLKTVYQIQVKKHEGVTSDWAVEQIEKYVEQMGNAEDEYTYIPWVVSMADSFSEAAHIRQQAVANEKNIYIHFVTGMQFCEMLLDCGLSDMDNI